MLKHQSTSTNGSQLQDEHHPQGWHAAEQGKKASATQIKSVEKGGVLRKECLKLDPKHQRLKQNPQPAEKHTLHTTHCKHLRHMGSCMQPPTGTIALKGIQQNMLT